MFASTETRSDRVVRPAYNTHAYPITFLGGAALLVGIAAVASCIPALRAARLDPIEVLRAD